jgi:tRNA (guanine37-N1)-methyltransferase
MRIDILTLFPGMVEPPLKQSIIGRAIEKGIIELHVHDIRSFTTDKHHVVDDTPFGGGAGMVMMVEPLYRAITTIDPDNKAKKILTDASGERFVQTTAKNLMTEDWLMLICGHYKGVDERLKNLFEITEISIGDYVLTGGEFPALVIIDAVARLVPGVIKEIDSAQTDSFFEGLLGYPEYTQPREFSGVRVPEVLLSGDHEKIRQWRLAKSLKKTLAKRPDLLEHRELDDEEKMLLSLEDRDVKNDRK